MWALCFCFKSSLLFANRLINLICWSQLNGTARQRSLELKLRLSILVDSGNVFKWIQKHLSIQLRPFLLSCLFYLDSTSFLGLVSAIPQPAGCPEEQQLDPCGLFRLSVLSACCGIFTPGLSPVQKSALPAHDHQRATGKGFMFLCAVLLFW